MPAKKSLNMIQSYLYGCMQKAKVGSCFGDYLEERIGVPHGSLLRPLFFLMSIYVICFFLNIIQNSQIL